MTEGPPGWALLTRDGKTEYVLALFAPSAEEAEAMSAAEAQRFVLDFAETIAEWMKGTWRYRSRARDEYQAAIDRRQIAMVDDYDATGGRRPLHFEEWSIQQILAAARGERNLA